MMHRQLLTYLLAYLITTKNVEQNLATMSHERLYKRVAEPETLL